MLSPKKPWFLFAIFLFFAAWQALGYDNTTIHPKLAEAAAQSYNNQAGQRLSQEQINWIVEGAIAEDADPRYLNHFYDPETGRGLSDGVFKGMPTTEWIQKQNSISGDYTESAILKNYKEGDFKRAYQGIGHMLHLIQDMSVPAHTRNDAHPKGDPYEAWAKQYGTVNLDKIQFANVSNLYDAFNKMASLSHYNFYSEDSVPLLTINPLHIVEDHYNNKKSLYLLNGQYKLCLIDNSSIVLICRINEDFKLNLDYWNMLYPKAVGYSAGVIDYFIKQFNQIDIENKQQVGLWQQTKNFFVSIIPDSRYLFGDVVIAAGTSIQKAVGLGSQVVGTTIQTTTFVGQATGETVAVVASTTAKAAQTATTAVQQTTGAITNNIKRNILVTKTASADTGGKVLGLKIGPETTPASIDASDGQIPTSSPVTAGQGVSILILAQRSYYSDTTEALAAAEETVSAEPTPPVTTVIENTPEFTLPPDTVAPAINIISSPAAFSNATSVTFEFSSSETPVSYKYQLDDGELKECEASTTLEGLNNGSHILSITATDQAGNIGTTSYAWTIDISAPTVIFSNLASEQSTTTFPITWEAIDNSSSTLHFDMQYKIGDGEWQDWIKESTDASAVFVQAIDNGDTIHFRVRGMDGAGNIGEWNEAETIINLPPAIIPPHVVISEIRAVGQTANDEFIELYNPTESPVNLSGWKLAKRSAPATSGYENLLTSFPDKFIYPHGYFLITHKTGYTWMSVIPPDATYSSDSYYITSNNTVILYSDDGHTVVDMVGFGTASSSEGSPFPKLYDRYSIERKAFATSTAGSMGFNGIHLSAGNGFDSDNNAEDFITHSRSDPQNSLSPTEPPFLVRLDHLLPAFDGQFAIRKDIADKSTATNTPDEHVMIFDFTNLPNNVVYLYTHPAYSRGVYTAAGFGTGPNARFILEAQYDPVTNLYNGQYRYCTEHLQWPNHITDNKCADMPAWWTGKRWMSSGGLGSTGELSILNNSQYTPWASPSDSF